MPSRLKDSFEFGVDLSGRKLPLSLLQFHRIVNFGVLYH